MSEKLPLWALMAVTIGNVDLFAKHKADCPTSSHSEMDCTCGYDNVKAELWALMEAIQRLEDEGDEWK